MSSQSRPPTEWLPPVPPPRAPERPERPEGAEPDRGGRPGWPPWTAPVALLAVVPIAVVGATVIALLAELAGATALRDGDTAPGVLIGGTLVQGLALVGVAVVFARMLDRPRPRDFGLIRPRIGAAIGWTLVAWFAYFLAAAVWVAALGIDESDDLPEQLGADESTLALIAVTFLVTVVAPIAEEFFFRGYFFTAMRNWTSRLPGLGIAGAVVVVGAATAIVAAAGETGIAVGVAAGGLALIVALTVLSGRLAVGRAALITGIVFGAIHAGSSPAAFLVPLAIFGVVLCFLYWKTGSLYPCIVLHSLNNSIALAATQGWDWYLVPALMVGAQLVIFMAIAPFVRGREAAAPASPA